MINQARLEELPVLSVFIFVHLAIKEPKLELSLEIVFDGSPLVGFNRNFARNFDQVILTKHGVILVRASQSQ